MKKLISAFIVFCISHPALAMDHMYDHGYESETDFLEKYSYSSAGIRKAVRANDPKAIMRIWAKIDENKESSTQVNKRNANGENAIEIAIKLGYTECVKTLCKCMADIHTANPTTHLTPLSLAASHGKERIVKYLLKCGADHTATDVDGKTALILATEQGHTGCMKHLAKLHVPSSKIANVLCEIKSQFNPTIFDTCLLIAAERNKPKAIHWLIKNHDASYERLHPKFIPGQNKPLYLSPLTQAVIAGSFAAAQVLITYKAHIHDGNGKNANALTCALVGCKPEMVDLLIEHGTRLCSNSPADVSHTEQLVFGYAGDNTSACYYDYLLRREADTNQEDVSPEAIAATKQALLAGAISSMVSISSMQKYALFEEQMKDQALAHMAFRKQLDEKNLFIKIFLQLPIKQICNISTLKYLAPHLSDEQLDGVMNRMPLKCFKLIASKLQGNQREIFIHRIAEKLLAKNYQKITLCTREGLEGRSILRPFGSAFRTEIKKLLGNGKRENMAPDVAILLLDTIKDRYLRMEQV